MVIFKCDPSGSPNKKGTTAISDRNYNIRVRDPLGIPQILALTLQTYGDTLTMTRIGMNESHVEY